MQSHIPLNDVHHSIGEFATLTVSYTPTRTAGGRSQIMFSIDRALSLSSSLPQTLPLQVSQVAEALHGALFDSTRNSAVKLHATEVSTK